MATTIINPSPAQNESSGNLGIIIGLVVLVVLAYLFFIYGLPMVKQIGSPQINIPSQIDVNVNQTK